MRECMVFRMEPHGPRAEDFVYLCASFCRGTVGLQFLCSLFFRTYSHIRHEHHKGQSRIPPFRAE